ncbi:MAG: cell division protein FtsL [Acidiferrobacterales bacterium]
MHRALAVSAVATLSIAMLVVALRHEGRQLFTQLQTLQQQRDALNVEWGKLLLEEGAWSEHRRVETLAGKRLGMATPDPHAIVVVDQRERK